MQVIVSDEWELLRCYNFSVSWYRSFVCVSARINTIFKLNFKYSVWKNMLDITLFFSTYTGGVFFFFDKTVCSITFWTFEFLGFQSGTAYSSILGYFALPVFFFFNKTVTEHSVWGEQSSQILNSWEKVFYIYLLNKILHIQQGLLGG